MKPRLFEPEVPIPEDLREAVELWVSYKKEQFRFTYKPIALGALVERMEKMGPARAMAAVKFSMGSGWEGLFEEKKNATGPRQDEDFLLQWSPGLFCAKCKEPGPPTEQEAGGWCIWRENGKGSRQGLAYAPFGALRVLCPDCR